VCEWNQRRTKEGHTRFRDLGPYNFQISAGRAPFIGQLAICRGDFHFLRNLLLRTRSNDSIYCGRSKSVTALGAFCIVDQSIRSRKYNSAVGDSDCPLPARNVKVITYRETRSLEWTRSSQALLTKMRKRMRRAGLLLTAPVEKKGKCRARNNWPEEISTGAMLITTRQAHTAVICEPL
jgi:hypothetical protein